MTGCLRFAPLVGSRPGELPEAEERALADHLATCHACSARAADAAALSALLREAFTARAASADLAPFADEVMARLVPAGAPARGSLPAPAPFAPERAGPWDPRTRPRAGVPRWGAMDGVGRGLRAFTARHPFAVAVLAPAALVAALALAYLEAGWPGDRSPAMVEVSAEGRSPTVLETAYGPIVLVDEDESTGS